MAGRLLGYGQGFSGYAKRYGATYGDRVTSTFFGAALLPSLLHQDPRYFYKGKGKIINRALYAISTVVICKGDNGHWQPNYSNVLGNLAAGGISSLYYPNSEKHDAQVTVDNILIGIGTGAIGTLFQEFLLKHLTHGVPPPAPILSPRSPPIKPASISYSHKPAPPHHAPPRPHRCTKTKSPAQSPQASAKLQNPHSA